MSERPRVVRVVMFKHGVAYLERRGAADGPFELSFKADEMNDVLKSLAVWVPGGGARVGSISFESPDDPDAALAARKLRLAPGAALRGLLDALRGREVEIACDEGTKRGEVIGVEELAGGDAPPRRWLLLRDSPASIATLDLATLRGVRPLEDASRADLAFLIDRSRAANAGDTRAVRVALEGKSDDVRVAYVVAAPVWRVSYRVVRSPSEATLMAWGIIHNPADEDLTQVELTLTTGQPVSFVIDLYQPKHVARAVIEEEDRAVAGPTRFERAASPPMPAPAPQMMSFGATAGPPRAPLGGGGDYEGGMADGFFETVAGATEGADRGEFFEYRVLHRVDVKRGGSAMVPLLAVKLGGARSERIWRVGSAHNPDLVFTFANDTGAVLEEGPAVVYDEGAYSGEAMVPYSARGTDVKLAYAKDLGVRCRHASEHRAVSVGLGFEKTALVEEQRHEIEHAFAAENDHEEPVDVVFELPVAHGRSFDPAHAQPFEETASFRHFRATVAPHQSARLVAVERWLDRRTIRYETVSEPALEGWLAERFLDQATFDSLTWVTQAWAHAHTLDAQRATAEREQNDVYAKQKKIAEQLGVLREGGQEGALRLRYVKELEVEQDRVNRAEARSRALAIEAEATRKKAGDLLLALVRNAPRTAPAGLSPRPRSARRSPRRDAHGWRCRVRAFVPTPRHARLRRFVMHALAIVALAYGACALSACGLQRSLLFPAPRDGRAVELLGGLALVIEGAAGDPVVHAFYIAASPGAPTLVHFHGNGEQIADNAPFAQHARDEGFGVLLVEYPGYGLSKGGKATEASLYAAADAALRYLDSTLGVPPARTVLYGQSLGTGVATEMAARGRGARLVLVSPFTSIVAMSSRLLPILPARLVVRDKFDSASKAERISMPVLVVHGCDDELIPVAMGRRLASLFPNARLVEIPGGHHNDLFHGGPALEAILRFARGAPR